MSKLKMLCWSDSATASTGFGTVSKYVIGALHATGKYDIDHLAINWHGQFVDKDKFPWQMSPARLKDPNDPHGTKMFFEAIASGKYDLVWVLNDTFVVSEVANMLRKLLAEMKSRKAKIPKIVYYYPVDCRIVPAASGMLTLADKIVAYTEHGKFETLSVMPELEKKMAKIHHGVNTESFKPFNRDICDRLKKRWFGVEPETFIITNVNRNSVRKQLTKTLAVFKEFQSQVPNSILYLHTMPKDREIDLYAAMDHLELVEKKDVFFPPNYSPSKGYTEEVLNELYNASDVFITNHLGEGWGLTVTEAMAAGVPVIAPDNTSMPEILGSGQRGYLYPCKELIYVDNSGYRPMGLIDDIVDHLMLVYRSGWKHDNNKVVAARKWALENNWDVVTKEWLKLFEELEKQSSNDFAIIGEVV